MVSLFIKNKLSAIGYTFIGVMVLIVSLPTVINAATLTVNPPSGTYAVGKTFSVSFYNNSPTQSTNAVSGSFTYSSETLEIISFSKSGTILSLWTQEPSYSNTTGTGLFEGIILNPGFIGTTGKIVTYTFRVKSAGTGFIKIGSASILANDGNGTNILTASTGATFTLVPAIKPTEPIPNTIKPESTDTLPIVVPKPQPIQYGGIITIEQISPSIPNSFKQFKLSAPQSSEIIRKYELQIDQQDSFIWEDTVGDGLFTAPLVKSGNHTITAKSVDTLYSYSGYLNFTISDLPAPQLLFYTKNSNMLQQPIVVYGNAETNTAVTISFTHTGNQIYSETVNTDIYGNFIFIIDKKLIPGDYTVSLFTTNKQLVSSERTAPVTISVQRYPFLDLGFMTISIITVFMICLGLLVFGAILILYFYAKLKDAKLSRTKKLANLVKDIDI